ncbi:MAG TPA: carbohydrate ABC transporter permease [Thermomicrobiales bacterium]|jgi:multiple sugar transport system permease protein|nr:carbohydrate ABC transporter permease [Thermomicrobiales bacterium]
MASLPAAPGTPGGAPADLATVGPQAGQRRRGGNDPDRPRTPLDWVGRVVVYLLLAIGGAIILIPFFWMLSTSLKSDASLIAYPPQWIPNPVVPGNYPEAWTSLPFDRWLLNTVFTTVLAMIAEIFTAALVAYGFARFRFPGRNVLFIILLSTMMLPGILTLIPKFLIWREVGRIDTFSPLTVGAWFAWGPSYIFLLRQFFLTIPREIEEAAIIDGANVFQVFREIMLPLVKPALLAIAVLSFQGNWNNFEGALIYLSTLEKYPMVLGLQFYGATLSNTAPQWNLMMAMATVMALPILVLFFLAQRYFIEGLTVGGVKG